MPTIDTTRPFRRQAALESGIGAKRLRGPGFVRVLPGVFVEAGIPITPSLRASAALTTATGHAHASHASAARVLGVPIPTMPHEYVTVPAAAERGATAGVRYVVRRTTDTIRVDGVRVSAPLQLFEELASLLPLVDLVVVGDHLVRRNGVTCEQLRDRAASLPGRLGRHARQAASYVRAKVDSPMETRIRMLLVLAGIPEPEVNLEIRDETGELLRRHDLAWRGVKVIVEYDGRVHIEREDCWERDIERREAVDADDWRVLTVVSKGVYRSPGQTVAKVFELLRSRGLEGLPPRPLPDWQPHFPERD